MMMLLVLEEEEVPKTLKAHTTLPRAPKTSLSLLFSTLPHFVVVAAAAAAVGCLRASLSVVPSYRFPPTVLLICTVSYRLGGNNDQPCLLVIERQLYLFVSVFVWRTNETKHPLSL